MPPSEKDTMKTAALTALWGLLLLFAGWGFVDSRDPRTETRVEIPQLRSDVVDSRQRIAVLEEALKNQRETLVRIEDGVNELRNGHKSKPVF